MHSDFGSSLFNGNDIGVLQGTYQHERILLYFRNDGGSYPHFILFLFSCEKRFFPEWIYADCMITVFVIFLATIILRLNLDGAFIFIHIVNPILLFLYWAVFCNHNRIKKHLLIATCLVFPLVYLMIAKIVQLATGNCPFPARLIFEDTPLHLVIVYIVAVCLIFLLLSFILHFINKAIHKKTPQ